MISLAPAERGDRGRVADEISRACAETGFFVVRDHGIDRKVFDKTYELSLDFFRGRAAEHDGASGVGRLVLGGTEQMPFPADKRGIALRDALRTCVAACRAVADRVTELLSTTPDPQVTLLTEDGPGLQLRDLSGNWIDVDVPGPDRFIVGVGDLRARWSHDAYVSTPRPAEPGDRPRQSIAFFRLANDDAVVESFPEPAGQRPAAYVPGRDEQFPPHKTNALSGREEIRS